MSSAGLGRILGLVVLLGLLAAGLLLTVLPSGSKAREPSVLSAQPEGRRALFLLLEGLGWRTEVWTKTPGNLPRSRDVLFLPAVPEQPPGTAELVGPPEAGHEPLSAPTGVRRMRDPHHYLRFVEEGGTIVLAAREEELEFLSETLELDEFAELSASEDWETIGQGTCVMASGEELELGDRGVRIAGDQGDFFAKSELPERAEVLAHDVWDVPLVLRVPVGRGSIVLVAPPPELLDNGSIDEHDHALFAVRLVEELRPEERLLFDEYALGGWVPESPLALALAPGTIVFSAHLIALLLVLLWHSAWSRSFPRDPEPLSQVSALARARGFAATLARQGRWSLAARLLRSGVLARLMQRRRLAVRSDARDGELPRAELEGALLALFRNDERAHARARAAFLGKDVRDAEELERLGAELRALERSIEGPAAPAERRPRRRTTMLAPR